MALPRPVFVSLALLVFLVAIGVSIIVYQGKWRTPVVAPTFHSRGPLNALVVVTLYGDPGNPISMEAYRMIRRLRDTFPLDLRLEYRHLLGSSLLNRQTLRARELECASRFGKFWTSLDLSLQFSDIQWPAAEAVAKKLDIEAEDFVSCLNDKAVAGAIAADSRDAHARGIRTAPAVLLDGKRFDGSLEFPTLWRLVTEKLSAQQTTRYVPRMSAEDLWERLNSNEPPALLDARAAPEYERSHPRGAIALPALTSVADSSTLEALVRPWKTTPLLVVIVEKQLGDELFSKLRSLGVSVMRFDDMDRVETMASFPLKRERSPAR